MTFDRPTVLPLIFTAILLLSSIAVSADVQEPKTGISFPETVTVEQDVLRLAGVGVRTKLIVKVYAGALYLEPSIREEISNFQQQSAKPDQTFYDALIHARSAKLFVLNFVRNVEGNKIREAFEEGLEKTLKLQEADVNKDAEAFLRAAATDVKKGDILRIYIHGDKVKVISASGAVTDVENLKVAQAVTAIWLGRKPVSEDLRAGMVSRISEIR
jgi:hypothetical protein